MSDGWTFVFGAFVAVLFGWGFVSFANDLFLIFLGDTMAAVGQAHGFGRPVVWVISRGRRIPLSGFQKWLYTFMALFVGGASLALMTAYALAADLLLVNRILFLGALSLDMVWLGRRVVHYRRIHARGADQS